MSKFTAGPWELRPSSNPRNGSAWRDIVSTGCEFSPSYVGEALEHDARLMAAAPKLYAALHSLIQRINDCQLGPVNSGCADADEIAEEAANARAALAEATGEL